MTPPSTPLTGTFFPLQVPRLLADILVEHGRGAITFLQGQAKRSLSFDSGRVVALTSSLDEERFGSWLVARNLVDRKTVAAVAAARSPGQLLGDLLVERGHMTSEALHRELETCTLNLAAKLLFEGGSYAVDLSASPSGAATVAHEPIGLLAAAVRRVPDTGQFERVAGGARTWVASPPTERTDRDTEVSGFEKFLLSQLTTPRSLADLQAAATQNSREVGRALVSLVVQGLVEEHGATPSRWSRAMYPPASPRLRQLLSEIDPNPRRKIAGPTVTPAPGKGDTLDPEEAEEFKRRAFSLLGEGGDPREALKLLSRAVEVAPDADSLTVLAELEIHNPLWRPRALERLKQATTMAPQHTNAWLALANYWSLRFQPDKQRRCLEKVLSYEPRNEEARKTLEMLGPTTHS